MLRITYSEWVAIAGVIAAHVYVSSKRLNSDLNTTQSEGSFWKGM